MDQRDPDIEVMVLGTAQDGGVPQAGCDCRNCTTARAMPDRRRLVACLGVVDRSNRRSWMIDATPDFPEQFQMLKEFAPDCEFSGLFLTHAHIGHYTGLINLGPEVMGSRSVPVYATRRMGEFLASNEPWSTLIKGSYIAIHGIVPGEALDLGPRIRITPVQVPHRDELSDTVAYSFKGAKNNLFYCPDIDSWDAWDRELKAFLSDVDIALLDGTFNSPNELPGRSIRDVPHPLVTDTVERASVLNCEVHLIHLNHTNNLLDPVASADFSCSTGIIVASEGDTFSI